MKYLPIPIPVEASMCECPAVDDGSEEDFWAGYYCPIHGAESEDAGKSTPAQEGE